MNRLVGKKIDRWVQEVDQSLDGQMRTGRLIDRQIDEQIDKKLGII